MYNAPTGRTMVHIKKFFFALRGTEFKNFFLRYEISEKPQVFEVCYSALANFLENEKKNG